MTYRLIDFYEGTGTTHAGLTWYDFINLSHEDLESKHDYIQWVFPNPNKSAFLKYAPVLTIQQSYILRSVYSDKILTATDIMMDFYGLGGEVSPRPEYWDRWITENNHNFLRLTRIIKFLSLTGFDREAFSLLHKLLILRESSPKYKEIITEETISYWKAAVCVRFKKS